MIAAGVMKNRWSPVDFVDVPCGPNCWFSWNDWLNATQSGQ